MVLELTVENNEEFEQLLDNKDIRISKALVDTILTNLKGRKRHIPFMSVVILEDESVYDMTIDRKEFEDTLNIQLPIFERNELFEECSEMVKALNYLKSKPKPKQK
tara:strand:- start:1867 stop:2184 length:318 start_codon:yes stop_codon:yes gene_type:complete